MSKQARKIVSKSKRRFTEDGFDLDLTYITNRIIAMGFPSVNIEGVYRNNMKEIQKFFDKRHKGHFMIYNLCSERCYDPSKFLGNVVLIPFNDHNCPSFVQVIIFCNSVHKWLKEDNKNIAAIHCKAGKGRTGLMICAYLLYSKIVKTAEEALNYYGKVRTYNNKGVTIPSQKRWVYYFEEYLNANKYNDYNFPKYRVKIKEMYISDKSPKFNNFFVRCESIDRYYNLKICKKQEIENNRIELVWKDSIYIENDFKIGFTKNYWGDHVTVDVFSFWLNVNFIKNLYIKLDKNNLDKVNKDSKIKDFYIELYFEDIKNNEEY